MQVNNAANQWLLKEERLSMMSCYSCLLQALDFSIFKVDTMPLPLKPRKLYSCFGSKILINHQLPTISLLLDLKAFLTRKTKKIDKSVTELTYNKKVSAPS